MKKRGTVVVVGLLVVVLFVILLPRNDKGDSAVLRESGATDSGATSESADIGGDRLGATLDTTGYLGARKAPPQQPKPTIFNSDTGGEALRQGSGSDATVASPGGYAAGETATRSESAATAVLTPSDAEFILFETDSEAIAFANGCAFLELRGELSRLLQAANWEPRPDDIAHSVRLRLLTQGAERSLLVGEAWLIEGDSYAVFDDEDLQPIFQLGQRRRGSGSPLNQVGSIRQRIYTYGYPTTIDARGCNSVQ